MQTIDNRRVLCRAFSAGVLSDTKLNTNIYQWGLCNGGVYNVKQFATHVPGLRPSQQTVYIGVCLLTHLDQLTDNVNAYIFFNHAMEPIEFVCPLCMKVGHSASMWEQCVLQNNKLNSSKNQDRFVQFEHVFEFFNKVDSILPAESCHLIEMGSDGACLLNSMAYFLFGFTSTPSVQSLPENIANYPLFSQEEVMRYNTEFDAVVINSQSTKQRTRVLLGIEEVKTRYNELVSEKKLKKALKVTLSENRTWYSLRWHVTEHVRYEYTQNLSYHSGWGWLREMLRYLQESRVYKRFPTDVYVNGLGYDAKLKLRDEYLTYMQQSDSYMGDYEIAAACQMFRTRINIFKHEYYDFGGATLGQMYESRKIHIPAGSLLMYQRCIPSYYHEASESSRVFNILAEGNHFKAVAMNT